MQGSGLLFITRHVRREYVQLSVVELVTSSSGMYKIFYLNLDQGCSTLLVTSATALITELPTLYEVGRYNSDYTTFLVGSCERRQGMTYLCVYTGTVFGGNS